MVVGRAEVKTEDERPEAPGREEKRKAEDMEWVVFYGSNFYAQDNTLG